MGHRLLPGRPELYHGRKDSRPYFEGWYFKQVSSDGIFGLVVIPGVYRGMDAKDDHSFIQILHDNKSRYIRFPVEAFTCSRDEFDVSIGRNSFGMEGIRLDIRDDGFGIKAEIRYKSHVGLEKSVFSPSVMGPFAYLPGMQCNHGVLSLYNQPEGFIEINGKRTDAGTLHGYMEKDWGEAFPLSWLWLQGNGTEGDSPFSVMCSIATIPFGIFGFRGLIATLLAEGKQYRFATYNLSRIKEFRVGDKKAAVVLGKFGTTLEITAATNRSSILKAPASTGMDRDILESLEADISVVLRRRNKVIFKGNCKGGGLETSETGKVSGRQG